MLPSKIILYNVINSFSSFILGFAFIIIIKYQVLTNYFQPNTIELIILAVIFSIVISYFLQKIIYKNIIGFSKKWLSILIISSIVASVWFSVAIPLITEIVRKRDILILCADILFLSFILFSISTVMLSRPQNNYKPIAPPNWIWISYSLPMIFVWSLFLLAYWPGSLSYDSINQWEQMLLFRFNDWHPVFHTLINWLITRFWLSPAAISLTQIVAMGLMVSWGLFEQRKFGAPRWLPWLTIFIIIIIPSNGLMVITLWKDIFFSIAIVALTILVFKITMSHGIWIENRGAIFLLVTISVLVALFRHNGAPVAFCTLISLLISYKKYWKRLLLILILTVFIWVGIRGPIYDALKVDKSSTMSSQPGVGMALVHLIARYTNTDTYFSSQDRSLLLKIRPEDKWPYECQLETNLFFTKLDWSNLRHYSPDLAVLSAKLFFRNPNVFVEHVICTSSFLYQITRTPDSLFEPIETGVYPNKFGIFRESKIVQLKQIIDNLPDQSNQFFNWIIWRVPFWNYMFLIGIIFFSIHSKNWRVILVYFPIFINMLPFTFMAVLQSFRYVYPTLIVSALMSGYFLVSNPLPEPEKF